MEPRALGRSTTATLGASHERGSRAVGGNRRLKGRRAATREATAVTLTRPRPTGPGRPYATRLGRPGGQNCPHRHRFREVRVKVLARRARSPPPTAQGRGEGKVAPLGEQTHPLQAGRVCRVARCTSRTIQTAAHGSLRPTALSRHQERPRPEARPPCFGPKHRTPSRRAPRTGLHTSVRSPNPLARRDHRHHVRPHRGPACERSLLDERPGEPEAQARGPGTRGSRY